MTDPDGRYYGNVCQWKLKLTYLICINLSSFMNQTRTVSLQKNQFFWISSQLAFICSKLTIETVEQGVKYVLQNDAIGFVLVSLLITFNIYTLF